MDGVNNWSNGRRFMHDQKVTSLNLCSAWYNVFIMQMSSRLDTSVRYGYEQILSVKLKVSFRGDDKMAEILQIPLIFNWFSSMRSVAFMGLHSLKLSQKEWDEINLHINDPITIPDVSPNYSGVIWAAWRIKSPVTRLWSATCSG